MKYFKKITGKKCYLSPMNMNDFDQYTEWLNDLSTTKYLSLSSVNITLEAEKKALENLSRGHNYAIIDCETDKLIGTVGLMDMDTTDRSAEIGIFIGNKDFLSKGYGTEAINLLLDYSFNVLNFKNIMLKVFSYNKRAVSCYQKCGFKIIGKRRKAHFYAGKYHDIIYMDMLSSEFEYSQIKE
jgi:RimJ/RimL family protein N-acetyltransferase